MAEGEIVNKVAQSPLITFNLEDYLPAKVEQLDIAQFLDGGYLLREKEFRAALNDFDYSPFVGAAVRIHCSTDAILPAWASILVASKLSDRNIRSFWAPTEEGFLRSTIGGSWPKYIGPLSKENRSSSRDVAMLAFRKTLISKRQMRSKGSQRKSATGKPVPQYP